MLNFEDVLNAYPERLRGFKENILKEYLQYRILDIIYGSPYADKLVFMGGTAIRIVHQGVRFSEDIDFDNRGLDEKKFNDLARLIKRELSLDGYSVAVKNVKNTNANELPLLSCSFIFAPLFYYTPFPKHRLTLDILCHIHCYRALSLLLS